MKIFQFVNALILLLWLAPAFAFTADVTTADTALEKRARSLFQEIRCMVCQSETIADSNAAVAGDMRRNIRERLAAGVSGEKIKSDLAAQYGDAILMNPPLKNNTILLWFGPWLVLLAGGIAICVYFRRTKLQM